MYSLDKSHSGFSSHSRSNSYHPGDKSGRKARSRRSPEFCIRFGEKLRLVGEVKYVERGQPAVLSQIAKELKDYLSVHHESTSDWGHDVGFGLVYQYGEVDRPAATTVSDSWKSDRIFITHFATT